MTHLTNAEASRIIDLLQTPMFQGCRFQNSRGFGIGLVVFGETLHYEGGIVDKDGLYGGGRLVGVGGKPHFSESTNSRHAR